jgi:O-antigen/teichoic acid export membrane protein
MSSFVLLAESMTFIGQRMDTLVIASIRNAAAAAPYAAALKLQTGLQSLSLPVVYQLMPMVSDLSSRGESEEVRRRLTLATRATLQVTLPVAAVLALFADDSIGLWLGPSAPSVTARILVVLMIAQVVMLTAAPAEQVLVGVGRVRVIGLLALVDGCSNLGISIALVSRYGAIGAAVGTLATSAVLAPVKLPLAARALGIPLGGLAWDGLARPLVSTLPSLAAMCAVRIFMTEGSSRLLVGAVVGLGLALAVGIAEIGPGRLRSTLRLLGRPAPDPASAELGAEA